MSYWRTDGNDQCLSMVLGVFRSLSCSVGRYHVTMRTYRAQITIELVHVATSRTNSVDAAQAIVYNTSYWGMRLHK